MKKFILLLMILGSGRSIAAQTIDRIFVNLYTDSLKKGTFNYINVDGKLSNGSYLPLDTTQVKFSSTMGKFQGNSLWIPANIDTGTATITVQLISNPSIAKVFLMSIKQLPDGPIKTADELMNELKTNPPPKKKGRTSRNRQ